MRKPWVSLTIDQDLLERLDKERRDKSAKESKDISRSAYVSEMIERGLKKTVSKSK